MPEHPAIIRVQIKQSLEGFTAGGVSFTEVKPYRQSQAQEVNGFAGRTPFAGVEHVGTRKITDNEEHITYTWYITLWFKKSDLTSLTDSGEWVDGHDWLVAEVVQHIEDDLRKRFVGEICQDAGEKERGIKFDIDTVWYSNDPLIMGKEYQELSREYTAARIEFILQTDAMRQAAWL